MKKAIIGIGLIFAAGLTFAFTNLDDQKVPQAVKDAFSEKFPTAKKVDWEKENDQEWEAEFKLNKVEYSANFLADGTWKETEHEISETEVPQQILSSLKSNFPDYEIEEVEMSEKNEGTFYEFEIEKGKDEWDVTMDSNGKVLKKQKEDEEDEDED